MATRVLLPKFGQTVETGEINAWQVKEGDLIRKSQVLCEIATDKSALEVESQYEGTLLKILLPPGKTAPVGCVMAIIGSPGEAIAQSEIDACIATQELAAGLAQAVAVSGPAPALPSAPALPPVPKPAPPAVAVAVPAKPVSAPAPAPFASGRIVASPRARRLAANHQVPIALLTATGDEGRIVEADVRSYLDAIGAVTPAARAWAFAHSSDLRPLRAKLGGDRRMTGEDVAIHGAPSAASDKAAKIPGIAQLAALPALQARLDKPTPMRRAIAANMIASSSTIPAFQVEITVDATPLVARREADKASGAKISFGDYIAKAVALAIRQHPVFAATWTDAGVQFLDRVHIGFAVAVPGGLVTPVVHDADVLAAADIAARSLALVDKARAGKLAPADYCGAVFTLSNLGSFPVDRFVAIVPPGQSGIIAIGRIRDEVVVKNGGFFAAKLMSLTLSADHRYVDGADGAAFMKTVKELLENPKAW